MIEFIWDVAKFIIEHPRYSIFGVTVIITYILGYFAYKTILKKFKKLFKQNANIIEAVGKNYSEQIGQEGALVEMSFQNGQKEKYYRLKKTIVDNNEKIRKQARDTDLEIE